jgi:hypothetical protein
MKLGQILRVTIIPTGVGRRIKTTQMYKEIYARVHNYSADFVRRRHHRNDADDDNEPYQSSFPNHDNYDEQ